MFENIKTITEQEIMENGVCSAPDVLTGTPEENKKIFDKLCTEIVIPKLNKIIEEGIFLENLSDENTQSITSLNQAIKDVVETLGELSTVDIDGNTLCGKLENLRDLVTEHVRDTAVRIGAFERLDFIASSVVSALNYLYRIASPGVINPVSTLPQASVDNLMKIFRVFDMSTMENKFYVCKVKLPEKTGFSVGDTVERIYFDPYLIKERASSFRAENLEKFSPVVERKHYMNLCTFLSPEGKEKHLRLKYSTSLDGFLLMCAEGESVTEIWSSDNFKLDGVYHSAGYYDSAFSDLFAGCVISSINGDLNWLLNKEYFESQYFWEELGSSTLDATVEKSGRYTTLTLKKGEETKTVTIEDGVAGYTPIKGQDYFTEGEREEMCQSVANDLRDDIVSLAGLKPEYASTTDECTDTSKLYVLPDGFIYAYTKTHVVEKPNMFDLSSGSKLNYRVNSSGVEVAQDGLVLTDYIGIEHVTPYVIKIKGVTLSDVYVGALGVHLYNSSKTRIGASNTFVSALDYNNGVYTIDISDLLNSHSDAVYVRIALGIRSAQLLETDEDISSLFIEFVPKNKDEYVTEWKNTNHAFVPADYENVITELADAVSENSEEIYVLSKRLENADVSEIYPSCWDGAVEEVISKIEKKQREAGINGVTFAFFSDNHQRLGYSGSLIWEVMKRCNIPFAFFCGDSVSNDTIASKDAMEAQEHKFAEMMKCIPKDRFFRALGNHDGYYLLPTGERFHNTWEEKYSLFLSPLALSQNKVFGENGTYFYVDHAPSKTRFFVLNSVYFHHKTNADGTIANPDKNGFGQQQLSWVCNALETMPQGFDAVFLSHSPVTNDYHSNIRDAHLMQGILNAYVTGGDFAGEYTESVNENNNASVSVSFPEKGNVIGWFAGHIHRDLITVIDGQNRNHMDFKTVTITSDANISYDESEEQRDMNGDTSHAIDFVTVNKKTGQVSIIRLGVGVDRTYNYMEE